MLTDGEAYEVTKILEMNVQSGTGTAANYGCPAAGKTGTTDEARTPGSSATRPSSRPRSGSATRTPASRCRARRAAPTPRRSGTTSCSPRTATTATTSRSPPSRREFSPFFGKYSSHRLGGHRRRTTRRAATDRRPTTDQKYDPRFYEQAPLDTPEAQPPAEEVAPEPRARQRERQRERQRRTATGRDRRARLMLRAARADAVAELELIAAIETALADRSGRLVRWTGDDAAVTRARPFAVTSIDTLVDGVHFGRATHSAARHRLEGARHRAVRPRGDGRRGGRGLRVAWSCPTTSRSRSSWCAGWRSWRPSAARRSRAATWCTGPCSC